MISDLSTANLWAIGQRSTTTRRSSAERLGSAQALRRPATHAPTAPLTCSRVKPRLPCTRSPLPA
jgi:hypothetical protein